MKVLIEVIIISLLIVIGWRQPFSEHVRRIVSAETASQWGLPASTPIPTPRVAPRNPSPATTPRDVSWMWRRNTLDRPDP
jgi:hypothetical protein